jgi:actin-related protein
VLQAPKLRIEADPATVSWRGAALLLVTEAAKEMWVERNEWMLRGPHVLRERLPFFW